MTPGHCGSDLDRRSPVCRFVVPPCVVCERDSTKVVSRTPYCLYVRCSACGYVWSVPKPDKQPLGS